MSASASSSDTIAPDRSWRCAMSATPITVDRARSSITAGVLPIPNVRTAVVRPGSCTTSVDWYTCEASATPVIPLTIDAALPTTRTCGPALVMLSIATPRNPLNSDSTMISAAVPTAIPTTEMPPIRPIAESRRGRMYRSAIATDEFTIDASMEETFAARV